MNYKVGAKLGDLIHSLIIPKYQWENTGLKANIFLTEEGDRFTTGIEQTHKELLPILREQPFVRSFQVLNTTNEQLYAPLINLSEFRNSPLLFKRSWPEIYFRKFLPPTTIIPVDYKWLSGRTTKAHPVVMNRSPRPWGSHTEKEYRVLIKQHHPIFVCSNIEQYNLFPLKDEVPCLQFDELKDLFNIIATSSLFIGNQSSPLAMASALGIPRVAELRNNPDAPHYEREQSKTLQCFVGD